MQQLCTRDTGLCDVTLAIEAGLLVRILTVAHGLNTLVLYAESTRKLAFTGIAVEPTQIVRDRGVVTRGVLERLGRQVEPKGFTDDPVMRTHVFDHSIIVSSIHDHGYEGMVLRGRTQDRRTTDVDVLDRHGQIAIWLGDGRLEGVQIDDHEIDGANVVVVHHLCVDITSSKQTTVYLGVQGLDSTVHHFWEAGVFGYLYDTNASGFDLFCRAAGRQNLHTHRVQSLCKLADTRFV